MCRLSNQKMPSLLVLLCILVAASFACRSVAIPSATPAATIATSALTQITADILADPRQFEGRQITIIGYYRGWDLLGEVSSGPPVTRSDWVIRDDSGAIYVEAGVAVEGDIQLNPGSKADTNKILRVIGIVRVTNNGQPYIDPERIELVK